MSWFSHENEQYIPVHTAEEEAGKDPVTTSNGYENKARRSTVVIFTIGLAFLILLVAGASSYLRLQSHNRDISTTSCLAPTIRHEWRSLIIQQQYDYINAALCLRSTPSRLHSGMSLYEDFPFLHDVVGNYAHETAAFLTCHRYFIALYESSLRDECGYRGSLPYWDWSLDWKNLSQSPVFQSAPGFGGNSQPTSLASKDALVGGDRCVEDGPWAGMMVHWWSQKAAPHCLSRGFQDVTPMDDMGHHLSSEILTLLHQQPDYESFFLMMEHGVHNAVQIAIGGDIMFNTAPYDPLFYPHHAQLDRLWWRWQQIRVSHQDQYRGLASNASDAAATLDDLISMGDFAPPIAVRQLINTERGVLCYRY